MDVSYLWDPSLSWAAKGLYTWLLSQQPGTPVEEALKISLSPKELEQALEELSRMGKMGLDNPLLGFGGSGHVDA